MDTLYEVLRDPTNEVLRLHSISFFDGVIAAYPADYKKIIIYINQCFNYHSPYLVEEKDWGMFLMERFAANEIPEELRQAVMQYDSPEIVFAMAEFLGYQKQTAWTTLVAKQNLRVAMLAVIQGFSANISEKQKANELVSTLDLEINDILEKMKQDQKVFGNHKGYSEVRAAKIRHQINVAYFID
jgi:hypothetical protein